MNVENSLENEALSFHWHGMWQRGTPWMDGASMVTQCATLPGESFTYRFFAEVRGCGCGCVWRVCVWLWLCVARGCELLWLAVCVYVCEWL